MKLKPRFIKLKYTPTSAEDALARVFCTETERPLSNVSKKLQQVLYVWRKIIKLQIKIKQNRQSIELGSLKQNSVTRDLVKLIFQCQLHYAFTSN
jgi:hypothetical protein